MDQKVHLPKFLIEKLGKVGIKLGKAVLDLNWYVSKPYTPMRFNEEMYGMADACDIEWEDIRRINLLPELTQASCTVLGVWNEATADKNLY